MNPDDPDLETTFIPAVESPGKTGLLSDAEVERLGALNQEYYPQIRQASAVEKAAARERVRRQVEDRLRAEDHPWADVWARAVAYDHILHDAKYRVMLDWFNDWAKRIEEAKAFDRFTGAHELGAGGFGAVFRAFDPKRSDWVAIKVPHVPTMPTDRATLTSLADHSLRFFEEARKHAKIRVQGCVPLFDVGMPAEFEVDQVLAHLRHSPIWFSMQLVDGRSLQDILQPGTGTYVPGQTVTDNAIVTLMTRVAEILKCLHATTAPDGRGYLIHKDLKPANILLDQQGEPWLTDFGLATPRVSQLIVGNPISGTPAYMAPEQWTGDAVNAQTDIWAWAAIFHELLIGRPPFSGTLAELNQRICLTDADSPRAQRTAVPDYLDRILLKCLKRSRADRFGSFAEVLDALNSPTVAPAVADQIRGGLDRVEAKVDIVHQTLLADQQKRTDFLATAAVSSFEALTANIDHGDKPSEIKGRDRLVATLLDQVCTEPNCLIYIYAKAGLGKTALMKLLRHRASEKHSLDVAAYRFNRPLNDRDLAKCLLSLTFQVRRLEGLAPPDEYYDKPDRDRIDYLRLRLAEAVNLVSSRRPERRLLILVDALDEMLWNPTFGEDKANPLGISDPPERVSYILSTRDRQFIDRTVNPLIIGRSDTDHKAAIRQYVDFKLRDIQIRAAFQDAASIEQLIEASQDNFMYLSYVFEDLKRGRFNYLTRGYPVGLIGYYRRHWEDLWANKSDRTKEAMKLLVSLSFSGVTLEGVQFPEASFVEDELMSASGIKSREELRRLLGRWDQFLDQREIDGTRKYGFYSSSYIEFLLGELEDAEERQDRNLITDMMYELGLRFMDVYKEISTALNQWNFSNFERMM